jgi:hypothetical protein
MPELKILLHTFSIFGGKELVYRAERKKFISFSDTGGLGQPVKIDLSFNSFCRQSVLALQPEGKTLGRIHFHGKEVVFASSGVESEDDLDRAFLNEVLKFCSPSCRPDIWLPAKLTSAQVREFSSGTATGDLPLWEPLLEAGFLPVRFETDKNRMKVYALENTAEVPIASAAFSLNGATLQCNNRLLIGDKQLDGFRVDFPTPEVAARWLELTGINRVLSDRTEGLKGTSGTLVGLIGQVNIEGVLNGHRIERTAGDAQIDGTAVRILKKTGNEYFRFDFKSPSLAVDGKAVEFVVSPDPSSAIQITSESKPFLRAIYTNDAVNSAVIRSSDVGPFIARDLEGRFVRIEATKEGAAISYDGSQPLDIPAGLTHPILKMADGKAVLHVGDQRLCAELPMLEGICAILTGISLHAMVSKDFQNAIAQLLALEGKFLTHCVFGKLAAVHITLMTELKWDPQSSCSLVTRDQDKQIFLGVMAEAARELSLECETVINYLPSYVIEHDRSFLSAAGLANSLNYAAAESSYQSAVNGAGTFLSHFGRIEGYTSQFQSSRDFAARKDGWAAYAPLGASVAAGLFVNPVLFVGAIQQGLALKRGKDAKESVATETVQNSFGRCAREWDFIIRTLLPAISNRFVRQIYPLRLSIAHTLRTAYANGDENVKNTLHRVVARRLGRLTAFLDFPVSSDLAIKRDEYVNFTWGKQSHAEGIRERRF